MRKSMGIRHESIDPKERRAPLTPEHVRRLVTRHGVPVVVHPSTQRIFAEDDYLRAGATVSVDLSGCGLILGVKEVPPAELLRGPAYCFFSHTIKGQPANMPLLARILEQGTTLLDYELIRNDKGRRLIAFGSFAGYAGMINTLWALGQRLRTEGIASPFERIRRPHAYEGLDEVRRALREVGRAIRKNGLPRSLVPLVVGVTGQGRVARGAEAMLKLLPTIRIRAEELQSFMAAGEFSDRAVYRVTFYQKDMFEPLPGELPFTWSRFHRHPERFASRMPRSLPFLHVLVNGIYWEPRYPRLVTRELVRELWRGRARPRLRVIGDISCDVEGSIEITAKATTLDDPVFVWDPSSGRVRDGLEGTGPVVMSVDKLPAELPREASGTFGDALLPFVPAMAGTDYTKPLEGLGLPPELGRAVIAHGGTLTPGFEYLRASLP